MRSDGYSASQPNENNSDNRTEPPLFLNYYRCPEDDTCWTDCWSCTSNYKCPTCGCEIEPYKSLDL